MGIIVVLLGVEVGGRGARFGAGVIVFFFDNRLFVIVDSGIQGRIQLVGRQNDVLVRKNGFICLRLGFFELGIELRNHGSRVLARFLGFCFQKLHCGILDKHLVVDKRVQKHIERILIGGTVLYIRIADVQEIRNEVPLYDRGRFYGRLIILDVACFELVRRGDIHGSYNLLHIRFAVYGNKRATRKGCR